MVFIAVISDEIFKKFHCNKVTVKQSICKEPNTNVFGVRITFRTSATTPLFYDDHLYTSFPSTSMKPAPSTSAVQKKGHVCPPSDATHPRDRWETAFVYAFITKFTNTKVKTEGFEAPEEWVYLVFIQATKQTENRNFPCVVWRMRCYLPHNTPSSWASSLALSWISSHKRVI